jgi:hypothetical protein
MPRRISSSTSLENLRKEAKRWKERRITRLDASGLMTDGVLARIARLDHVTALSLGGSRQLTDEGLLLLARMPQLQTLELSEYPGGKLTDRMASPMRACTFSQACRRCEKCTLTACRA